MDKDRDRVSRKSERESTTQTPHQPGASRSRRSRPPSSASAARDKLKNEIAGAAGSAATRQWIKTRSRQPEIRERKHDADPSPARRKPVAAKPTPSSASAARDKLKNEIAGAAGSAATRQWIKTAIASAGNPREKARRRPLTSPAQAGRGEADPRARPRCPRQTKK